MEIQDYLRAIRNHWVGVIVLMVLTVASAAAYTHHQPRIYAADSSGILTSTDTTGGAQGSVNDSLAKSRIISYLPLATSRTVAQSVIDDLGLKTSPEALIGSISVQQPLNTVTVTITAQSTSPVEAEQLADAWVKAFAAQIDAVENPTGSGDGSTGSGNGSGSGKNGKGNGNGASTGTGTTPTDSLYLMTVDSAVLPGAPISPNVRRNLLLALLLGLLVGVAYAVVRSIVDRRLRSPEDVERAFGVPIVGRLPMDRDAVAGSRLQVHGVGERTSWGTGEAFRKLRSNLAYMNVDDPPRVVVVTSPRPRDGKSTTAANLAAAIAMSGQPVTLLDGDLRRPTVATTLGLAEGAGLTDVLIGKVTLDDVLQEHVELEALSVLAAGSLPPNPSELLGSQAMQNLLKELSSRGIVIIDAPPVLPVTDGAVLTRHADGALVVIGHGTTLDAELAETLDQLASVQGKVLGIVFNRMPRRAAASKYGYYTSGVAQRDPRDHFWQRGPLSRSKPAPKAPTDTLEKPKTTPGRRALR